MKKQPREEISAEAYLRLNYKKGMTGKHNPDDTAFIPESGRFIREVRILRITGSQAAVRFTDTPGGIKIRKSRLFPTEADARASIKRNAAGGFPI